MMGASNVFLSFILVIIVPTVFSDGFEPPFGCNSPNAKLAMKDDNYRKTILNLMNDARRKVAEGNQEAKQMNFLPQAQNMYELAYNCTLEQIAFSAVANCPKTSSKTASNGVMLEHEANTGAPRDLERNLEHIWLKEVNTLLWPAQNKYESGKLYNNYALIVRGHTTSVGCAEAVCAPASTVACVFDTGPIVTGDQIYVSGPACPTSPCTTYDPSSCVKSLCRKEQVTTTIPTTTPSTIPTTTVTFNPDNTICPFNLDTNDRIRTRALQMHNYRRSELALGRVRKNNGNLLPSAANMMQLKYDCHLEKTAKAYADRCSATEPNTQTNVLVLPKTTRVQAMEDAVKTWWRQVRLVEGIGMQVTFKSHHVNAPIRTFTRMAWGVTDRLGCGVGRCGSNYSVVCNYSPGGNVVNQVVYIKGTPCTACPTGTSCSQPLCVAVI